MCVCLSQTFSYTITNFCVRITQVLVQTFTTRGKTTNLITYFCVMITHYPRVARQCFLALKFLLFIFLYYFEFYYYLFSLLHLLKLIYYLLFFWKISYMSRQKLYQKNFSLEQDFSFKLLIPFLQWISRKSFGKMLYQSIFIPNFW